MLGTADFLVNHCTLHIPSTAPMLCMLFVLIFIVFMYYFTCISFAIRTSGRKSAIKLIELFAHYVKTVNEANFLPFHWPWRGLRSLRVL